MLYLRTSIKYTQEQREAAFWHKVKKRNANECWEWLAYKDQKGYGIFYTGKKNEHAHRFALELKLGRKLIKGEHSLHHCDNPGCVNPLHLFSGTNSDNVKDKMDKGRHKVGSGENAVKGEHHHKAKLKNEDIIKIRKLHQEGVKATKLASKYNVDRVSIHNIVSRRTWKHL